MRWTGCLPHTGACLGPRPPSPESLLIRAIGTPGTFGRLLLLANVAMLSLYLFCCVAAWQLARREVRMGGQRPVHNGATIMAPIYFVLLVVLVGFLAVTISRGRNRRLQLAASDLATTLGFQRLEGREALKWMVPGTSGPSSTDHYENLPGPLRKLLEASGVASCIAGTVDGVRIAIFTETRGGGKSRTRHTVVRAWYATPLPYELRIGHEGGFTRLGKALFGLSDVETGEAEFDRAVRVKAGDEGNARAILGAYETRAAILRLLALSKSAFATNVHAQWERQGVRYEAPEMRSVIAALVPVARALGG